MRMREAFVAAVGLNRIARFHLDPVINGAMRIFTNRSVMITVSSAHVAPRLPRCLPEKLAVLHTDRISQTENGGSGVGNRIAPKPKIDMTTYRLYASAQAH